MTKTIELSGVEARAAILRGDAPEGLSVDGNLDLRGCEWIESLPEGLSVGGNLYLRGCERLRDILHMDSDGYGLVHLGGEYRCGCRRFATAEAAIAHWEAPDYRAPALGREKAAAVRKHAGIEEGS